jgi:glutamate-ammonia-ligase adenylyltransferase
VAAAGRQADPVKAIASARTLRRRELARIASADLLGMLDVRDVCSALTSIWVAVLQAALEAVIRENLPDDGVAPASIAVIGMGRLGAAGTGLRLRRRRHVRLRAGPGIEETIAVKWSVSVAEQVRALLGTPSADPPLEVDANLRPEGRNGRWCAPWRPTRPTTSSGRRPGKCRRCCARTGWPAIWIWESGSW